jgi:hypothetical protein
MPTVRDLFAAYPGETNFPRFEKVLEHGRLVKGIVAIRNNFN